MDITSSFEDKNPSQITEIIKNFEEAHKEDLEAILQVLVKITSRTPEQIKPHLDAMLERVDKSSAQALHGGFLPFLSMTLTWKKYNALGASICLLRHWEKI